MGVKGRRIINDVDEPTLLGDIDSIINKAKKDGFINGYSVDIKSIIEKQGIEIKYEEMPSTKSGYLRKVDNKWIIGVNRRHHVHRQKYTLAHEFAHYILHRAENNSFEDEVFYRDEVQTSIEYSANTFAAKLLMPEEIIEKAIKEGLTSLKELAAELNLSPLAVKSRILSMGYKLTNNEE